MKNRKVKKHYKLLLMLLMLLCIPLLVRKLIAAQDSTNYNDSGSILDSATKRGSGNKGEWKVVNWNNPFEIGEDDHFSCEFTTFESSSTHKTADMCVHKGDDIVSNAIRSGKRWGDCDLLPSMWKASMPNENSIYLEIGANIGSCVMEMLLETKASIIAFEPNPINVFNIKKTIANLDPSYHGRLKLFPIGLGDEHSISTVYTAHNNKGNSVIGTIIKDFDSQIFDEDMRYDINVERLDSILNAGLDIKLMKMDVQGYECKVMEGMAGEVASSIDAIKFEWAHKWLAGQKCYDLIPRLHNYGFDIYASFDALQGMYANLQEKESSRFTEPIDEIVDLYAKRGTN